VRRLRPCGRAPTLSARARPTEAPAISEVRSLPCESQKERIQSVKDDDTKDDHDVRKQEEVLAEYVAGQEDENDRLLQFYEKLCETMDTAEEEETFAAEVEVTEEWTAAKKARGTAMAKLEALGKLSD